MADLAEFFDADPLFGQVRDALKRKRKFTVETLADQLDVSPKRIRDAVEKLREAGYRIPAEVAGRG